MSKQLDPCHQQTGAMLLQHWLSLSLIENGCRVNRATYFSGCRNRIAITCRLRRVRCSLACVALSLRLTRLVCMLAKIGLPVGASSLLIGLPMLCNSLKSSYLYGSPLL